ncbi:pilin N-terminal domain-containing protein [Enterococcus dongliensis]|uniref:Pilin N-terminal domain-containing protein n=1 Tax=Enterococcus dongliensis TaxID=2559925 RepID=A0ABU3ENA0_9ENTE|nr:pilin N-terminal domain-containing protein [Enterococcus dongliensis]MDT2596334.1 pilin N-terminal domain-containing protein [Enterococcus dongliensis]MDT2604376.1 pilin N-terminal domain-containing protein [Enterococcus dongliensis]MDT2646088.1 pilin N-terminal domain-containing protein [Enterococcus dongliensis]MDT2647692.1 pilin N-terminal domain-containing protein [Enterococcus dongliensis]MDT2672019.1 pilin N-terminal domain-containing protein [Enterococcus dongliensis]
MKKLKGYFFMFLLLLPFFVGGLGTSLQAEAQTEDVELIVHKRMIRDVHYQEIEKFANNGLEAPEDADVMTKGAPLNGAHFKIYDMTDYYLSHKLSPESFMTMIATMSRTQISELIKNENLQEVAEPIETGKDAQFGEGIARVTVPKMNGERYAVYLLFESHVDSEQELNVDIEKLAVPLAVILPIENPASPDEELEQIHIYPKNVGYLRDPYFFKYGKTTKTEEGLGVPLAGAEFVLYRIENGEKKYLKLDPNSDLENDWVSSDDQGIARFVSDKDGLVSMKGHFLASGTYYFEEVKGIPGYEISEEDKAIEVIIPEHWEDQNGNPRYVTVNGQNMDELIEGGVPKSAYEKVEPRVYNYQVSTDPEKPVTPGQPTTPEQPTTPAQPIEPSSPPKKSFLPVTGEAKTLISLIGLVIVGLVIFFWYRRKIAVKVTKDE